MQRQQAIPAVPLLLSSRRRRPGETPVAVSRRKQQPIATTFDIPRRNPRAAARALLFASTVNAAEVAQALLRVNAAVFHASRWVQIAGRQQQQNAQRPAWGRKVSHCAFTAFVKKPFVERAPPAFRQRTECSARSSCTRRPPPPNMERQAQQQRCAAARADAQRV